MPSEKKTVRIIEVCGTHTMSIAKYGLRGFFKNKGAELISGPGCPVCVTPASRLEQSVRLARDKNVIITVFGDMIRVPAVSSSLQKEISSGADIRIVYSAYETLKIARNNPDKEIVFAGAGFETTLPSAAAMIFDAQRYKIKNVSLLSMFKSVFPAINALLDDKEVSVDGLLLPGNVAAITGAEDFYYITDKYRIPCAIAGFSRREISDAVNFLSENIKSGRYAFENLYSSVVCEKGNIKAKNLTDEVFCLKDDFWRGFGKIKKSGFRLNKKYEKFDADKRFNIKRVAESKNSCRCGDIMKGRINPSQCGLFAKKCTPSNPFGPCMVSSEGACSAYYKYGA